MDGKRWCLDVVIPQSVKIGVFGNNLKYIEFNEFDKNVERAFNSNGLFGSILKEDDEKRQISTKVLIKFISDVLWIKYPNLTFSTEIAAYNKVLPYFSKFQPNIQKLFPKFYYGITSNFKGIDRAAVILELMPNEYKLTNQVPFLDFPHLSLMLKEIAKFHACSYIAKNEDKIGFKHLVKNLHETYFTFFNVNSGLISITSNRCLKPLKSDVKYRDKLDGFLDAIRDADEFMTKALSPKNDKIDVICHGDFLSTNTLFKYDPKSGDPIGLIFFDLANARYASPITDIILTLYLHTDQKTRDLHWVDLLDCYYDSLTQSAPIQYLPTKQEILQEFNQNSVIAFIVASYYLPNLFLMGKGKREKHSDMEEVKLMNEEDRIKRLSKWHKDMLDDESKSALLDIARDMIDRSYI